MIELLCKSYSRFSKCSLCIVINLVYLEYKVAYSAKIHTVIQSLFQRGSYIGEKINFCMIKEPFLLIEMINNCVTVMDHVNFGAWGVSVMTGACPDLI